MISAWQASIVNDVAIGRLYEPLRAEGTKPICLASDEITTDLVGAGWGLKNCYQDSQETLRRAKVIFSICFYLQVFIEKLLPIQLLLTKTF